MNNYTFYESALAAEGYYTVKDEEIDNLVYTEYDDGSGHADLKIGSKEIRIAEIDRAAQDMFYRDRAEKDYPDSKMLGGYKLNGYTEVFKDETYKQIARNAAMKYLEREKKKELVQEK